jgi:ComF family protein
MYFHKGEMVQEMIHRLKYKNQVFIGISLGKYYSEKLLESSFLEGIDYIFPIPIHKSKKRKRGYNQSSIIAKEISKLSGIPWDEKVLVKKTKTSSQTDKSRHERFLNLMDTFQIKDGIELSGKHILLIDDILTTGSTLEAAGSKLREKGALISIAVIAVGKY